MKIKNRKNEKLLLEKTPTKLSWPMSVKSDKFFIRKEKKTKLPWLMSAKGFFSITSKNLSS